MGHIINLPMVNLTPTMRCNLKCKLCGVLVPQYDKRPQMTTEEFSRTLKSVFEIADHVDKLQITGGEPLLHPQLSDMLKECFLYSDQFETLWLFTNCAVPLSDQVAEVLGNFKDKILVHASDYGVKPEVSGQLTESLKRIGVEFRYLKYFGEDQYSHGWVDQGDFEFHDRSESQLKSVFSQCSHVVRGGSWYVRNGQIHWCGRSVRGMEVGKIPCCEEDYVNIFEGSASERKEKFRRLLQASCISACNYCNGLYGTEDVSKRLSAGEQMGL